MRVMVVVIAVVCRVFGGGEAGAADLVLGVNGPQVLVAVG